MTCNASQAFFNFSIGAKTISSPTSHRRRKDLQGSQIERLKRDSKELKHYIKKQEKKGDSNLVYKLRAKYEYLNSKISEVEMDIAI